MTKNARIRPQARYSSCDEVAAETRKTARQGIQKKVRAAMIPVTALILVRTQNAEDAYCRAPSESSRPLLSASTLINALPESPKSVIAIQVRRLLMVSQTPYRSA